MCDHIDHLHAGLYMDSDNPPHSPTPAPSCLRANAITPVLDREELSLLFVSGPRLSGRKLAESLCFLVCSFELLLGKKGFVCLPQARLTPALSRLQVSKLKRARP